MADYHTVYKGLPGDTTQWDDIQRRLGNLPAKPPVWKPDTYKPEEEEAKDAAWLQGRDAQELSDLEDEFEDDRFLEQYRRKRIAELLDAVHRPRFGSVEEIRAAEFVQKVTEASKGSGAQPAAAATSQSSAAQPANEPSTSGGAADSRSGGGALWVVVQLYKDGHSGSAIMSRCLDELAEAYPLTKFVRIVSTDCIPKYPDSNLPTLLVYHDGRCIKHLVGLAAFGGPHATAELVAMALNRLGPVCSGAVEEEEGQGGPLRGPHTAEDVKLVRKLVDRMVADRDLRQGDDESSDFDS